MRKKIPIPNSIPAPNPETPKSPEVPLEVATTDPVHEVTKVMGGKGSGSRTGEVVDLADAQQLRDVVSTLSRSGAVQWFYTIRRRPPGMGQMWSYWKRNIPVDAIDDIRSFCEQAPDGGAGWEYRVRVHNDEGKQPFINGKTIGDHVIPATIASHGVPTPGGDPTLIRSADPIIIERQKALAAERDEIALQRQEAMLEKERRRIKKMGEEDEEEDDDYPPYRPYPPYGYPGMQSPYGAPPGQYPGMTPWNMMQRPQQNQPSDMVAMLQAMMTSQQESTKLLIAMMNKGNDRPPMDPIQMMIQMKALNPGLEPKDMMGMFSPMMSEMGKMGLESQKILMQNLAEGDRDFRKKVLELVMATSDNDDDIDRWRKILNVGTDTLGKVVAPFLGRKAVKKGAVTVPLIGNQRTPGLPAPQAKPEVQPEVSDDGDPAVAAKKVVHERITLFLRSQEQEMLVGSDAATCAEKLDELYNLLPEVLRIKIEAVEVDKIYDALKEYEPKLVDRIFEAVKKDESGAYKGWIVEFWQAVKDAPWLEDGEDGEEEDEGGEGDEPEPGEPEGDGAEEPAKEQAL